MVSTHYIQKFIETFVILLFIVYGLSTNNHTYYIDGRKHSNRNLLNYFSGQLMLIITN